MPKRQLSAKEILQDIRAGVGDTALMEKYQLSAQGLQSVFTKLVAAGVLKQGELDNRASAHERIVNLVWKCPACGKPQPREFEECPDCGVIVHKYKERQQTIPVTQEPEKSAAVPPHSWTRDRYVLVMGTAALIAAAIVGLWAYNVHDTALKEGKRQTETAEKLRRQAEAREAREKQTLEKLSNLEKIQQERKKQEDYDRKKKEINDEYEAKRKQIQTHYETQKSLDHIDYLNQKFRIRQEQSERDTESHERAMQQLKSWH